VDQERAQSSASLRDGSCEYRDPRAAGRGESGEIGIASVRARV